MTAAAKKRRMRRPSAAVTSAAAGATIAQAIDLAATFSGHPLPPGGGAVLTSVFALVGGMFHRDGRK
jgi:hypothetical protein